MAAKDPAQAHGLNCYSAMKNNPENLEARKRRNAEMEAAVQRMLASAPGRLPCWNRRWLMQMDRFCLENNKRCIMWDDEGPGFYLLLNWDWLRNRPAQPATPEAGLSPGWWYHIKEALGLPLLDPSQPEEQLAAWVDARTMRVHCGFLDKLDKLRWDEQGQRLVLDDPYWRELQQLPPWRSPADAREAAEARGQAAEAKGADGAEEPVERATDGAGQAAEVTAGAAGAKDATGAAGAQVAAEASGQAAEEEEDG